MSVVTADGLFIRHIMKMALIMNSTLIVEQRRKKMATAEDFFDELVRAFDDLDNDGISRPEEGNHSREVNWDSIMKSLEDAFDEFEPEQLAVAITTKDGKRITIGIKGDEA